jgi:hypothetical protein
MNSTTDAQKTKQRDNVALPKKCASCSFLKPPKTLVCPACGFKPEPKWGVINRDGELIEFLSRGVAKPVPIQVRERESFYRQLKSIAIRRQYRPGWVAHQFKKKFGCWPTGLDHFTPVEPSAATLSWIKSRQIAFAKARRPAR